MLSNFVNSCPLLKQDIGGLSRFHSADDDAVQWLEGEPAHEVRSIVHKWCSQNRRRNITDGTVDGKKTFETARGKGKFTHFHRIHSSQTQFCIRGKGSHVFGVFLSSCEL